MIYGQSEAASFKLELLAKRPPEEIVHCGLSLGGFHKAALADDCLISGRF